MVRLLGMDLIIRVENHAKYDLLDEKNDSEIGTWNEAEDGWNRVKESWNHVRMDDEWRMMYPDLLGENDGKIGFFM